MEKEAELKFQEVLEEYERKDEMGIPMSIRENYWNKMEELKEKIRKKKHQKKLGRVLLEKKLLSDEELQKALTKQAQSRDDKLIGEVLLEEGLITEEQLERAVKEQVRAMEREIEQ